MRRVRLLQDALAKAIVISKEATQRIEEFQIQLSILQRQCSARDRPLCDTLRLRGFEDNGILNTLTRVIVSLKYKLRAAIIQFTFDFFPILLLSLPSKNYFHFLHISIFVCPCLIHYSLSVEAKFMPI